MKKNTLQKVLALALAGVMAMGTLTACGNNNTPAATDSSAPTDSSEAPADTGSETPADTGSEEPAAVAGIEGYTAFESNVTLRIPVYDRGEQSILTVDNNFWTGWLQENFGDKYNITLEFVPITRGDVLTDYALLAASGDLPTILMEYDYPKQATWAADGYLTPIDMEAFAQVAPDYYNRMVENDVLSYTVMNDETYFVLAERPLWQSNYKFINFVRMDWLREVGYDYVPVIYSEWCDAMQKIKDAGIAEYPAGGKMINGVGSDQNYGFREFPVNEEEWAKYSSLTVYTMGWEADYKFLKRENQKYNDGFLNPEFFITDDEADKANFINGKNYQYGNYMSASVDWLNAFYEQNPDAELAVVPVMTMDDPEGGTTPAYRSDNPFGMIIGFSSFATEDQIKAAWMYMEWMTQEENLFTLQWGFEGENYVIGEDGDPVSVGDYEGEFRQGFNNNKDYFCVTIESRNADTVEKTIAAIAPQGLPQDFYNDMLKVYNDQTALAEKGYAFIDPIFAASLASETEYAASLASLYLEYRDQLVKCPADQFDALYEELTKKYENAGFSEVVAERYEMYQNGQTTVLPEKSKK